MFTKKTNIDQMDTIIGANTIIEGTVKTDTSLRIEGKVYGKVECNGDLTIGSDGYVETVVNARNIMLAGTIKGEVHASGKLQILSSGRMIGQANMAALIIEDGGRFEGESKMGSSDTDEHQSEPAIQSVDNKETA